MLPAFEMRRRAWPVAIGLAYIAVIAMLGGLRSDHVVLGLLGLLDAYNPTTRNFLRRFFPFILTGVVYDSMRYFYWRGIAGHVYVAEPYLRDRFYFGIPSGLPGPLTRWTPNEFFQQHHGTFADLLTGFAYLAFVGEYLAAAIGLFLTRRFELLRIFGWCFFVVNLMGFVTYFIYPAPPPWYVSQYGLGPVQLNLAPSAAAAARFDALLGTHFFDQIYGRGVDVFGAYPSLHVSYPFLVAWVTFQIPALGRSGGVWIRAAAVGFYLLMCFSAVYLQHHYVVDILLGTLYAFVAMRALSFWLEWRDAPVAERRFALEWSES